MLFLIIVFSDPSRLLLIFFDPIEVFKKPKPHFELIIEFELGVSHFNLCSSMPHFHDQSFKNFDFHISGIVFISAFEPIKIPIKPPEEYF
jgi:hypothetical protein